MSGLENAVAAMLAQGVTAEQFREFAVENGIEREPFIEEVLHRLLVEEYMNESMNSTVSWTEESADDILETLATSQRSPSHNDDSEYEHWGPLFVASVLKEVDNGDACLACLRDDKRGGGKTFYCAMCKVKCKSYETYRRHLDTHPSSSREPINQPNADPLQQRYDDRTSDTSQRSPSHNDDSEYEHWSPLFVASVLKEVDNGDACLACLRDDKRGGGKTFYCSRCKVKCKSYETFRRHLDTHPSSSREPINQPNADPLQQRYDARTSDLQVGGAEEPYLIEMSGVRQFAKNAAIETTYRIRFNDQWKGRQLRDLSEQLRDLFADVLARARERINDNDLLRVVLRSPSLHHAAVIPLMHQGAMNVDKIMSTVANVVQSEENLTLDDSFEVLIGSLHIPQGTGSRRRRITKLTGPGNSIHKKTSMVQIVNDDQLCMARAIGVGLAKNCVVSDEEWTSIARESGSMTYTELLVAKRIISSNGYKNVKNKNRSEQKDLATLLCLRTGVPTDRPGCLNDLPAFERTLRVRIAVLSASLGNTFIRVPNNEHDDWPLIYLYLINHEGVSHFHVIVNIAGFFSSCYFCERCFKQYDHNTKHRCAITCLTCKSRNCPETKDVASCRSCHMVCRSPDCFERHLVQTTRKNGDKGEITLSQCDEFWQCTTCKKVINRRKRPVKSHDCAEWLCKCCKSWVTGNHRCYLFPEEPKKPISRFIFFDFEATQDTIAQCNYGYDPRNCCEKPCKDCPKCQRCCKSWCGQPRHVPNFAVAQTVCTLCENDPLIPGSTCDKCGNRCTRCDVWDNKTKTFAVPPCSGTCGAREVSFSGESTLDDFGAWLFSSQHKDTTVMAHNMKGYDGVFLLEYLLNNSMRPSKVIYNGSKIMYMEVAKGLGIRVLDSLNFLPMKLAALPEAFGLTELCKGYFPHFFNKRENQSYVGPYPEAKAYGVDYMSTEERAAFLLWHEEKINNDSIFDFRREMKSYCQSDVDILRRACLQFRQLMLTAADVDPFQYVTIASVCMGIYKTRFLEAEYNAAFTYPLGVVGKSKGLVRKTPDGWLTYDKRMDAWEPLQSGTEVVDKKPLSSEIAQVSSAGYVQSDNFSKASIHWLEYLMERARLTGETLDIRHALNGGETSLFGTRYKFDGLADRTVYEYHGCLWHGCPKCYPDRTVKNPKTGQTMNQLYALTLDKKRVLIEQYGYQYVCIWEHDWLQKVADDTYVRDFVAGLDIQERLDPRESFFGGRTNAAKLLYEVTEGEKIKYIDFTSLYPYVNKYSRYPVGHPEIITSSFGDIKSYFGIAKVMILAPRGLYHPVLPYRSNGKLKFPLCRTCADTEARSICRHSDRQRAFLGTWCTPEIEKALDKGYTLVKIYEVYHWDDTTQYDPVTREGGLFATYVNTFLKFKQEASGWPDWCRTETQRVAYVSDYYLKEGVRLNPDSVEKNPGLRALAKLCLNSFWGKFGQRLNQGICEFIHASELDKFFKILTDETKSVKDFRIINEDHLHLEYEHQTGFVPEDTKTNIFLATFTTSGARLKLYGVLDRLEDRVLYYDTDSVIYISRPGQYDPPLGDYLGELTDELKDGAHIVQFVSGGPKNYAYVTSKGKQTCKIRGFSLNYANSKLLNFESVREMVGDFEQKEPAESRPRKRKRIDDPEQSPIKTIVVTNPGKISRDKLQNVLYNRREAKKYRVVYDKRVIGDAFDTLPYGY